MKKLFLLGIIAVVALAGIYYFFQISAGNSSNNGGERMFVEALLSIDNPVSSDLNIRPIEYGLKTNQEYVLRFTAEKFMNNINGTMSMRIVLPNEFQVISGETEWEGNDKQKAIEIRFKPTKPGNYTVQGDAINLDNKFATIAEVTVFVNDINNQ
ncbi:MAG: hypothetical protein WA139_01505 [Candidatus Aenigmatarchaeota archaeon]